MKKLILSIMFILFFAAYSFAGPSTRAVWDESPEPNAAGYYLYYGTESGVYPNAAKIEGKENNCYVLTDLPLVEGVKYYLVVTAYNDKGFESGYSNEVIFPILQKVNLNLESGTQNTTITIVVPNCP